MTETKMSKTDEPIQGVITGCNQNHEWLLKGWWHHFSKHNTLPVAFVDFGMSASAKAWCEKKGQVISMDPNVSWITPKSKLT